MIIFHFYGFIISYSFDIFNFLFVTFRKLIRKKYDRHKLIKMKKFYEKLLHFLFSLCYLLQQPQFVNNSKKIRIKNKMLLSPQPQPQPPNKLPRPLFPLLFPQFLLYSALFISSGILLPPFYVFSVSYCFDIPDII